MFLTLSSAEHLLTDSQTVKIKQMKKQQILPAWFRRWFLLNFECIILFLCTLFHILVFHIQATLKVFCCLFVFYLRLCKVLIFGKLHGIQWKHRTPSDSPKFIQLFQNTSECRDVAYTFMALNEEDSQNFKKK